MSATVVLQDTSLEVVPGEAVIVPAVVTNTGSVVDAITLDVVGLPDGWTRVEPPEVRLLPGRKTEVRLVVDPPRRCTTATGLHVLGLRAQCQEDPAGSSVEEAVLEVLPFVEVDAELVPRSRTARGLRKARFVIAVDNRGNAPITVGLDAVDPDQHLALAVARPQLECVPGSATFGTLLVRGQRRYWRGPQLSKGFLALVHVPGQEDPIELPGALTHTALLPQSLPRLAGRLALLCAALAALLLLVVPTVTGAASREADEAAKASAEEAVAPVADTAAQAAADAEAARRAAEDAVARVPVQREPTPTPTPSARTTPTTASTTAPSAPVAVLDQRPRPFTARLQVSSTSSAPFLRIDPERELSLSGFVLQPNGDRGEMALLRDGVELVTARLGATEVFDLPAPVVFGPASSLQFSVVCRNPVGDPCDAAVLLTGSARALPPASPAPSPSAVAPEPAASPEPARTAAPLPEPEPEPEPTPTPAATEADPVPLPGT